MTLAPEPTALRQPSKRRLLHKQLGRGRQHFSGLVQSNYTGNKSDNYRHRRIAEKVLSQHPRTLRSGNVHTVSRVISVAYIPGIMACEMSTRSIISADIIRMYVAVSSIGLVNHGRLNAVNFLICYLRIIQQLAQ